MTFIKQTVLGILITSLAGTALAEDSLSTTATRSATTSSSHSTAGMERMDAKTFVKKAMEGNLAEVKLAKLAQQKAQNQELKQFAQELLRDHSTASNSLHTVARQIGVEAPTAVGEKHQQVMTQLQGLSGQEFDKQFTIANLKAHAKHIQIYEQASKTSEHPEVKRYAQQTLPTLRAHLKESRTVATRVGLDESMVAQIVNQASQPSSVGGSEDLEGETTRDSGQLDEGADSKTDKGAGAEQLTEGLNR